MRIRKQIMVWLVALAFLTVIGSIFAYHTAKWLLGTVHRLPSSANSKPPDSSGAGQQPPVRSANLVLRGAAMGKAYRNGELPSPLPMPAGSPEQAAAELAKKVMAADEQSTAALLTAMQMSGFSVRGEDGTIIVKSVEPGQGILFDAWEAAATAKLFGEGLHIKLADLGNALASTVPALKNAPVSQFLMEGIGSAALSQQSCRRFWADFIVELGGQSEHPYNLLATDLDPANADLDAVQLSFILRRIVADLEIQAKSSNLAMPSPWIPEQGINLQSALFTPVGGQSNPVLKSAVWHVRSGPSLIQVGGTNSNLPCTLSELAAEILDSSASASGFGFEQLLDYLKEHGVGGAKTYGDVTSVVNGVLALIKLIAYFACLETDIAMSGPPPLIRTQSPDSPGEARTLTATVKENIGNWQVFNCVRLALNGANLDFSLPNNGPVVGAEIQWVLVGSGVFLNQSGPNAYLAQQILQFVNQSGSTIQNSVGGTTQNFTAPKTDENGQAQIDIEGTQQKPPLQGTPQPIMKQSEVRFTVAPKPISMSQDIIDAVGTGFLGGLVGKVVAFPVELLLRSNIHFSKSLVIPVKDWTAAPIWSGKITYEVTSKSSGSRSWGIPSGPHKGPCTMKSTSSSNVQSEWDLTGSKTSYGTLEAIWSGKLESETQGTGCGGTSSGSASGHDQAMADIQIVVNGNEYFIGVDAPSGRVLNPNAVSFTQVLPSDMNGNTQTQHSTGSIQVANPAAWTGKIDASQPGRLSGRQSSSNSVGGTTTLVWDLELQ